MSTYTADVTIGEYAFTLTSDDDPDDTDLIFVLDDLKISWEISESDPWPAQPKPNEANLKLMTRDVDNLAGVDVGTPMSITLTAGNKIASFNGRVGDLDAQLVRRQTTDGHETVIIYELPGVDYLVDLAELPISLTRAAENQNDRVRAIVAAITAAGGPEILLPEHIDGLHEFDALTLDQQPALDVLLDHLRQIAGLDAGDFTTASRPILVPITVAGVLTSIDARYTAAQYAQTVPPAVFALVDHELTLDFEPFTSGGVPPKILRATGDIVGEGGGIASNPPAPPLADDDDDTYLVAEEFNGTELTVGLEALVGYVADDPINLHVRVSITGGGDYPGEAAIFLGNNVDGSSGSEVAGFSSGGLYGGTGFYVPLVDGTIQDLVIPLVTAPWGTTVDDVVTLLEAGAYLIVNTLKNVAWTTTPTVTIYEAWVEVGEATPGLPGGLAIDADQVDEPITWRKSKFGAANLVTVTGPFGSVEVRSHSTSDPTVVKLPLDSTFTSRFSGLDMARMYLPDVDASRWAAEGFTWRPNDAELEVLPFPLTPDSDAERPIDCYLAQVAIFDIPDAVNPTGPGGFYAGTFSAVTVHVAGGKITADLNLAHRLPLPWDATSVPSWDELEVAWPDVVWSDGTDVVDPDLSWYDTRLARKA